MPPFTWTSDPMQVIQSFETRHKNPSAGALFAWAIWAVDSLHYLDDIDRAYNTSQAVIGAHRPDVVDVAHARWATATCITALDLCAAGIGRSFCAHVKPRELDLASFDSCQLSKRKLDLRALLPPLVLQWVDSVCADVQYKEIKKARDWLVHSRVSRHFTLSTGGPPQRLKLEIDKRQLEVRHVIEVARDVATRHVVAFVNVLPRV